MSKNVKYLGEDQMPANMYGLPLKAVIQAENAVSSQELLGLRHIFANMYNPPLAFDTRGGEFEYLVDQQSFELFLAGFAAAQRPMPALSQPQEAKVSVAKRITIPKHNVEEIERAQACLKRAADEAEEAKAAALPKTIPVVEFNLKPEDVDRVVAEHVAQGGDGLGKPEAGEKSISPATLIPTPPFDNWNGVPITVTDTNIAKKYPGLTILSVEELDRAFIPSWPREEFSPVSIVPPPPAMNLESATELGVPTQVTQRQAADLLPSSVFEAADGYVSASNPDDFKLPLRPSERVAYSGYAREVGPSAFKEINDSYVPNVLYSIPARPLPGSLEEVNPMQAAPEPTAQERRQVIIKEIIDPTVLNSPTLDEVVGAYREITSHGEPNSYEIYWHVSRQMLEKNLTNHSVALEVASQEIALVNHNLLVTLADPESQVKLMSFLKSTLAPSEETVLFYLVTMLIRYEGLKLQTQSRDLFQNLNDVIHQKFAILEPGIFKNMIERVIYTGPQHAIPPADSDVVVIATGFPLIEAFELQLRAHGHTETVFEKKTQLVFSNQSEKTVGYVLSAFSADERVPVVLFHGAYQEADFDQLAAGICQAMIRWSHMQVVLELHGLVGELRKKVIMNVAFGGMVLLQANFWPLVSDEEAASFIDLIKTEDPDRFAVVNGLNQNLGTLKAGGEPAGARVYATEAVHNQPEVNVTNKSAIVNAAPVTTELGMRDRDVWPPAGLTFSGLPSITAASTFGVSVSLMADAWVKERAQRMRMDLRTEILRHGDSTMALAVDLALSEKEGASDAVSSFLKDFDAEVSKRLNRR
jgi:hypothetical protein